MKRFSLFALLAVVIAALALVGCGGGGGGGTNLSDGDTGGGDVVVPPPPGPGEDPGTDPGGDSGGTLAFITGRVVDQDSGAGVAGVTVIVTNKPGLENTHTAITTSTGDFQVALQDVASILDVFDLTDPYFRIQTSTAGTQYLDSTPVLYNSNPYNQDKIVFKPADLLNAGGDLGTIGIKSITPDSGDEIPENPPDVPPAL